MRTECQADYMLKLIDRWQTENIHAFSPKMEAVEDFLAHTDAFMKKTIWEEDCRSWYKNNSASARVSALWPGSTLHYIEAMQELRADDWDITYKGNRFAWLGDGYSQTELDQTCDLGYYIRDRDDSPYSSKGKRRKVLTHSGSRDVAGAANPVGWAPEKCVKAVSVVDYVRWRPHSEHGKKLYFFGKKYFYILRSPIRSPMYSECLIPSFHIYFSLTMSSFHCADSQILGCGPNHPSIPYIMTTGII